MSNSLETRQAELLSWRDATERQVREVQQWLSDPANIHAVDSTIDGQTRSGESQRLMQLLKTLEYIDKQMAASLPLEENYPVALGVDSIGIDRSEYTVT